MPDVKLGNRHECSDCGTKFYDLGKPKAACPRCGAAVDEAKEPVPARRRKTPAVLKEGATEAEEGTDEDADGEDADDEDDDDEDDDDEDDDDEDDDDEDLGDELEDLDEESDDDLDD